MIGKDLMKTIYLCTLNTLQYCIHTTLLSPQYLHMTFGKYDRNNHFYHRYIGPDKSALIIDIIEKFKVDILVPNGLKKILIRF